MILLFVMVTAFILQIFLRNWALEIFVAACGAVLFGIYIIYDTRMIVGLRSSQFSTDDYIMAAMFLYIDIIQIFLEILRFFGTREEQSQE